MKTPISQALGHRGFYDFTTFGIIQVQPGTRLTPSGAVVRSYVIPDRKRRQRRRRSTWTVAKGYYIALPPDIPSRQAGRTTESQEAERWVAAAQRAHSTWMAENAY